MSQASAATRAHHTQTPRGLLLAAFALVMFSITATAVGRWSDVGAVHMPASTAVETLLLRFEDLDDGGVAVRDARDQRTIYKVEPQTTGFIRATLRGLARERMRAGVGPEIPFALIRWSNGSISLHDETSGRRIDLDAFGPTNAQAFAQFFTSQEPMK